MSESLIFFSESLIRSFFGQKTSDSLWKPMRDSQPWKIAWTYSTLLWRKHNIKHLVLIGKLQVFKKTCIVQYTLYRAKEVHITKLFVSCQERLGPYDVAYPVGSGSILTDTEIIPLKYACWIRFRPSINRLQFSDTHKFQLLPKKT